MQPEGGIDPSSGRVQYALLDHRPSTAGAFLAGLEHEDHVPGQLVPQLVQNLSPHPISPATCRSCPQACMVPVV